MVSPGVRVPRGTSGEWSEEITALEKVMDIFTALCGESDPRLNDLVTPFRRLVRTEQVKFQEMPFSSSSVRSCTLYIFKDLVLLAEVKESGKERSGSRSTLQRSLNKTGSWLGTLTRSSSFTSKTDTSSIACAPGGSNERLAFRFDLMRSNIKSGSSENALVLSHVYRMRDQNNKLLTKVDMIQLLCENGDQCSQVQEVINNSIQEVRSEALDAAASTEPAKGTVSGGMQGKDFVAQGQRKWARSKGTLKRNASARSWGSSASSVEGGLERRDSGSSIGSASSASSMEGGDDDTQRARSDSRASLSSVGSLDSSGGLSLSDLEARYQVDFDRNKSDKEAEFSVTFGAGSLGFSLSSSAGLGAIVGKVATDSMAFIGGVEVGDRVVSIGEHAVSLETHWRDCVQMIQSEERPLEIRFLRNFTVSKKVEKVEHAKATRTKSGRRNWASRKAQHRSMGGSAIISLAELEKMYQTTGDEVSVGGQSSDGSTSLERRSSTASRSSSVCSNSSGVGAGDVSHGVGAESRAVLRQQLLEISDMFQGFEKSGREAERACGSVLREIFETERAYVTDLRCLVGDFMIPLRRTVRRVRCKDRRDGSTFCEHRAPRMACKKQSKDARPVLEPSDLRAIFLNIETLIQVNTELLSVVQSGLRHLLADKQEDVTVADMVRVIAPAFTRVMPFFKMYSLYCHQYGTANDRLIMERSRNKELHALLKQREERSNTTLQALLIKPVQRICKYPLLFRELLKAIIPYVSDQVAACSAEDMASLEALVSDLEKTLATVDSIAKSVNRSVLEQEDRSNMLHVFNELGGEAAIPGLMSPARRFVTTETCLVRRAPFQPEVEPHQELLYMFNDLLVFTKCQLSFSQGYSSDARKPLGSKKQSQSSMRKFLSLKSRKNSDASSSPSYLSGRGSTGNKSSLTRLSSEGGNSSPSIVATIELRKSTAKAIADPDETGAHGIMLTYASRSRAASVATSKDEQQPKTAKDRRSKRSSSTLSANWFKPDKVVTAIDKLEIWMPTQQARDNLFKSLTISLEALAEKDAGMRKAEVTAGMKKTREYKTRNKQKTADLEKKYASLKRMGKSQAA